VHLTDHQESKLGEPLIPGCRLHLDMCQSFVTGARGQESKNHEVYDPLTQGGMDCIALARFTHTHAASAHLRGFIENNYFARIAILL
jgi:hypothetical protein